MLAYDTTLMYAKRTQFNGNFMNELVFFNKTQQFLWIHYNKYRDLWSYMNYDL